MWSEENFPTRFNFTLKNLITMCVNVHEYDLIWINNFLNFAPSELLRIRPRPRRPCPCYGPAYDISKIVNGIIATHCPKCHINSVSGVWTNTTWWWRFGFSLKQIYATAPAASKNNAHFNSGQKGLENNHLAMLV